MRRHYLALPCAVAVAVSALTFGGALIKYDRLKPLGLSDGVVAAGLPFRMISDDDLKGQIELVREMREESAAAEPTAQDGAPDDVTDGEAYAETGPREVEPEDDGTVIPAMAGEENAQAPTLSAPEPETGDGTADEPVKGGDAAPEPEGEAEPGSGDVDENAPEPLLTENGNVIVTGPGGVFTVGDTVEDSWFDDALFIGDSRTDGLSIYCRAGKADYFTATGLTVFSALTAKAEDRTFGPCTLGELLESRDYGKIFICLGVNECGDDHEKILRSYGKLVDTVKEAEPGAVIIIEGIMACGRDKAENKPSFGPENLNDLNAGISEMAESAGAYYIDPNTAFADSEGYLPDEFSGDGCHLYGKYYDLWMDWIRGAVYDIPLGGEGDAPAEGTTGEQEENRDA